MRRRDLSEEEQALWRRAVSDVKPARRPRKPAPRAASPAKKPTPSRTTQPPSRLTKPASRPHKILGGGDPALDRSAGKRIAVERTLDLHGLTQAAAHRRLLRFLEIAAKDGIRLALVITGKGGREGRGVLKARFLDWIEEMPMRSLIARVSPARARDGGAGAFYVFLKRRGAGK